MSWLETLRQAALAAELAPKIDRFWFLRHGLTDANQKDIVQGWLDTPLNSIGEGQVAAAAPILAAQPISHIIASPLLRARRSAEIVASITGHAPIRFSDDLRERSAGRYEGEAAAGRHFWELADASAETLEQFVERVVRGLNAVLTEGAPLVVAHGGIRRVMFAAFGIEDTHFGNAIPLEFTRLGTGWVVERLSADEGRDTQNLRGAV